MNYSPAASQQPLLDVVELKKVFPLRRASAAGWLRRPPSLKAVDGVSFQIGHQEVFGLVGESGSGKSTIGHMIARLTPPTGGDILLDGGDWLGLSGRELRQRRHEVQIVFQNPYASLDPRMTVEAIVAEPLLAGGMRARAQRRERVVGLLRSVGLDSSQLERFPHQFSGGQRQRIGLARALALSPRLLVADEPTSALDVSVQAQILQLLKQIQDQNRLSILLISHNLAVVKYLCDRVGVLYSGRLVEIGRAEALFAAPLHPYTEALLQAVPEPRPHPPRVRPLEGESPSPANPPRGCRLHPRCPKAKALGMPPICSEQEPPLRDAGAGHLVACHFVRVAGPLAAPAMIGQAAPG